jgi:hypothetical protein
MASPAVFFCVGLSPPLRAERMRFFVPSPILSFPRQEGKAQYLTDRRARA